MQFAHETERRLIQKIYGRIAPRVTVTMTIHYVSPLLGTRVVCQLCAEFSRYESRRAWSQKPSGVLLPHRLILRMGVIAFAGVDFVAVLLGNDLDFPEFSIPVLVLRVVPEAVLVMEFV